MIRFLELTSYLQIIQFSEHFSKAVEKMATKGRKGNHLPEEDETRLKELDKDINDLPENDPRKCEGLIRELHRKISTVRKDDVKDQLLTKLKTVSCRGLSNDLGVEVKKNGLDLEGLELVLKYLTTKTELAQYLFTNSTEDVERDGLEVIRRRLGPNLEVLGGLLSKGIDVTKEWAKKLVKEAPSLQSLARISISDLTNCCQGEKEGSGASPGEMDVVRGLIRLAESRTRTLSATQEEPDVGGKDAKGKAIDDEKLEKARALMKEAKEMAAKQSEEAKTAVKEKLAEVTKILKLHPDWNKQEIGTKPDQLFEQLDKIIEQFDNVVEVGEAYKSDLEVVTKASGGRALCGIYFSQYVAPIAAERPIIIKPAKVTLTSPNNSQQI